MIHSLASRSSITSRWQPLGTRISYGQTIPFISDRCSTSQRRPSPREKRKSSTAAREKSQNSRHAPLTPYLRFIWEHSHAYAIAPRPGTWVSTRRHRLCSMLQPCTLSQEGHLPSNASRSPNSPSSHLHPAPPCPHQSIHRRTQGRHHTPNLTMVARPHRHSLICRYEGHRRLAWEICGTEQRKRLSAGSHLIPRVVRRIRARSSRAWS